MSSSHGSVALFACTRCNGRYRFEELSSSQQLCKNCRSSVRTVKCTYCRTEFQEESKQLQTICKKCESNVKQFGKPSACEYCNIIAAFIGNKCQRCTNSEKRYGPPMPCHNCKQKCAFDRKDSESNKKLDGKLLCWLCTISMKKTLAKARQHTSSIRHASISSPKSSSKTDSKHSSSKHHSEADILGLVTASKKPRLDSKSNGSKDMSQSDVLRTVAGGDFGGVAISQLKEQISSLQKQLQKKDQELLEKDKKIAEMTANWRRDEKDLRDKILAAEKKFQDKTDMYQQKILQLQKQNATLSKQAKKTNINLRLDNNPSPQDSPII